jgi:hypothetical protein
VGVAGGDEDGIGVVVTIVAEGSLRDFVPLSSLTSVAALSLAFWALCTTSSYMYHIYT